MPSGDVLTQELVTILAVAEDSEAAFEKHDRCSAWAAKRGWIVRKRVIIDGTTALDSRAAYAQLQPIIDTMVTSRLVVESLSDFGPDGLQLAQFIEELPNKGMSLHALKEAPSGITPTANLLVMLGAYCANDVTEVVYAGSSTGKAAVQRRAESLGWDLLFSRAKEFERQLQSAPQRTLVLASILDLGDSPVARARAVAELMSAGRRVFCVDTGIDSAASNAQPCMLSALSTTHNPSRPAALSGRRSAAKARPSQFELLTQWASRRRKVIKGSVTAYIEQTGHSPSHFFRKLREGVAVLQDELARLLERDELTEPTRRHFEEVASICNLDAADVEFAIAWVIASESRSRSSSGTSTASDS